MKQANFISGIVFSFLVFLSIESTAQSSKKDLPKHYINIGFAYTHNSYKDQSGFSQLIPKPSGKGYYICFDYEFKFLRHVGLGVEVLKNNFFSSDLTYSFKDQQYIGTVGTGTSKEVLFKNTFYLIDFSEKENENGHQHQHQLYSGIGVGPSWINVGNRKNATTYESFGYTIRLALGYRVSIKRFYLNPSMELYTSDYNRRLYIDNTSSYNYSFRINGYAVKYNMGYMF